MESDLPKVLHRVGGKALIERVIETARQLGPDRVILIVGHGRDQVVKTLIDKSLEYVVQDPPLGTGHAVLQAKDTMKGFGGEVVILSGDVPLLRAETLRRLVKAHREQGAAVTVLTTVAEDPTGYGRILRNERGEFVGIIEHREATDEQRRVSEINSGIYCCDSEQLFLALSRVRASNSKGEYYLTDIISILRSAGRLVRAEQLATFKEICGINTPAELAAAEEYHRGRSDG